MSRLADIDILDLILEAEMIKEHDIDFNDPYAKNQVGKLSWGLSSYGFDARLDHTVRVPIAGSYEMDPKKFPTFAFMPVTADRIIIPPNNFILGRTIEYFKIPRDVSVICLGKSTYARCGIICNVTPLEPEWEGYVTLEISNTTAQPAVVYPGEGICQFMFDRAERSCQMSYKDKGGKYQGQKQITPALV